MPILEDSQRLVDLVRHQRGELFDQDLLTPNEYAELAMVGSESARRLETYDCMRERIKQLERALLLTIKSRTDNLLPEEQQFLDTISKTVTP